MTALLRCFGAVFLLHAPIAFGALNYQAQGADGQLAGLRLSEAPCVNEKVRLHLAKREVPPQYVEKFKAAVLTWGGRDWHSCWVKLDLTDQHGREHEMVWSIDEEGAPFNPPYGIPFRLFLDDSL